MMQMNRQWMNTDRRSREYIAGMHAFLEMTKLTRTQRDSFSVHALYAEMTKTTPSGALFTSTSLKTDSWRTMFFGPAMVKEGYT
jgi:hypothetical protein